MFLKVLVSEVAVYQHYYCAPTFPTRIQGADDCLLSVVVCRLFILCASQHRLLHGRVCLDDVYLCRRAPRCLVSTVEVARSCVTASPHERDEGGVTCAV